MTERRDAITRAVERHRAPTSIVRRLSGTFTPSKESFAHEVRINRLHPKCPAVTLAYVNKSDPDVTSEANDVDLIIRRKLKYGGETSLPDCNEHCILRIRDGVVKVQSILLDSTATYNGSGAIITIPVQDMYAAANLDGHLEIWDLNRNSRRSVNISLHYGIPLLDTFKNGSLVMAIKRNADDSRGAPDFDITYSAPEGEPAVLTTQRSVMNMCCYLDRFVVLVMADYSVQIYNVEKRLCLTGRLKLEERGEQNILLAEGEGRTLNFFTSVQDGIFCETWTFADDTAARSQ